MADLANQSAELTADTRLDGDVLPQVLAERVGARELPLNKGFVALVDAADFDWLSQWKWTLTPGSTKNYAARLINPRRGSVSSVYLHRLITQAPKGLVVDHINGDGLDNRRANLRLCTHSDNRRNAPPTRGRRFKGVYGRPGHWIARLMVGDKYLALGTYAEEEDAARAFDAAARKHFPEFMRFNFPEEVTHG